jgi:hypothetical protein
MNLPIPDAVLAQHVAVLGMTGSGKTSTEKLIVEQVVEKGARVCVLDTIKSDWWGITSSATGKSAGLPFKILGGPRGHVPLPSSAGKVIGQLVASGKLPLSIIDMADFEAGGIQRFFVDFAAALWKHQRGVVYLVIEEAHELAPKERAGFGAENMAIHWAKKLATGSRTKGIRLVVATQRVQALHNAVLGSCGTLVAHQLAYDADQEPVKKWLKSANKARAGEVADSLAGLPTGTGWICSPRAGVFEKVKFPKFRTFDNTATPDGDDISDDVKTAPVDRDELRAIIGDAVTAAEADDPSKLRAEIARLKGELAKAPTLETINIGTMADHLAASGYAVSSQEQIEAIIANAFDKGARAGIEQANASSVALVGEMLRPFVDRAKLLGDDLGICVRAMQTGIDGGEIVVKAPPISQSGPPAASLTARAPSTRTTPQSDARATSSPVAGGDGTLTAYQQRILDAIAWVESIGQQAPSRSIVAFLAGASPNSSTFERYISALKGKDLISYPANGALGLTGPGRRIAAAPTAALTHVAILQKIREKVTGYQFKLVTEICKRYPKDMSRDELAAACGVSANSSTFERYVSQIKSLGLITASGPGRVRADERLFP